MESPGRRARPTHGRLANPGPPGKSILTKRRQEDRHTLEAKRCKRYPAFSLDIEKIKTKMLQVLRQIATNIFALPFLRLEDSGGQNSIDNINEKLMLDLYDNTSEVFDDLESIFNQRQEDTTDIDYYLANENYLRRVSVMVNDKEMMGTEMRKKLMKLAETVFAEDLMEEKPVASKVFSALEKRFPYVATDHLKARACEVADNKEDIWKMIVRKLNQDNENAKPNAAYKKYRFTPSQQHDFEEKHVVHQYIAGYQFYRMIMRWSDPCATFPIPLRKVSNPNDAISSIDYISNTKLEEEFAAQKEKFRGENKEVTEMLLFHGTAVSSVDGILTTNFRVDHTPLQLGAQTTVRNKKMMFGSGVYFSEMPAISLMYGNGLVLCKVLLGKCERYKPVAGAEQPEIPTDCDSREVVTRDGEGVIHVVKSSAQILPYCVIQLKNDSLSSEYRKPQLSKTPAPPALPTTAPSSLHTPPPSPRHPRQTPPAPIFHINQPWNIVKANTQSPLSKEQQAAETLSSHSTPVVPALKMTISQLSSSSPTTSMETSTCPVCLESLEEGVVALTCGHALHAACGREVVLKGQGGPGCLQCPECLAIQGTRTGSQPTGGQMAWTTLDSSLPGHPACGTIAIQYSFPPGLQGPEHPRPGAAYLAPAFPRTALLPDSPRGRALLLGLCVAFRRRLTFTVGRSLTSGLEDCVTWAGIHHKTQVEGPHGFPDPGYLARLEEELRERGVTPDDIEQENGPKHTTDLLESSNDGMTKNDETSMDEPVTEATGDGMGATSSSFSALLTSQHVA